MVPPTRSGRVRGVNRETPIMPALFALGQHRALVAVQSALHPSTKLMAFLDDVYVVTTPPRVADSYAHLDRALWEHAGIRINQGKTQIFNRAGVFPPGCHHILRAGRQLTPPVVVWRGDSALPSDQQGVTILGTPLGHVDFVRAQLRAKIEEHRLLLDRVEAVPDLQCAWLILSFCGATRANYYLRTIHPSGSEEFAGTHDAAIMRVFFRLLDIRGDQDTLNLASLPCRLGSVGLHNAVRGAPAAYWSSWADSLHMIQKRHPDVADFITVALSRGEGGPHMEAAARCRGNLVELGFEAQSGGTWHVEPAQILNPWPTASHMGGSRRLRTWWKTVSWLSRSGQHSHPRSRPLSVLNRGQWQVSRTLACLSRRKRRSSRKSSGCCSSDVFGNLCPCLRSPASVAVHSTLVATTVQRVRWQGCWAAEDFRWRAQQLGSAGRQGEGSRPMSESRTWTSCLSVISTTVGWKWWLMASPCSGGRSWPSTPPWCLQSGVTGQPGASAPPPAEQLWTKVGGAKSGLTPSWSSSACGLGL